MEEKLENKIINLEVQLAYNDKTILDLNEIVLKQEKVISKLSDKIDRVELKLKALSESSDNYNFNHEKPPHY